MPQKSGLEALKSIYRKNPTYFHQFIDDADSRAVAVLGPLFGVDQDSWTTFKQEFLGSGAEKALARFHKQLTDLLAETSRFLRPTRSSAATRRAETRKPRLTPEVKAARLQTKRLRLEAHRLLLKVARNRGVSPAVVYAELTKKYGHKAKEAGVQELQDRISFLKTIMRRQ